MMRTHYGHEGRARILVANRDRINALTLSAILDRSGYKVATVFDGQQAIAKAASFAPNLFIAEPFMSWLSGIEAAAEITAALPACRVLFLSADASSSDISNVAPDDLVYSFVSEPVPPLDLLNAVAYMLPVMNSSDDPPAMNARQHAVDTPETIRIVATTDHGARRLVSVDEFRLIRLAPASHLGGYYFSSPAHLKRLPVNRHLQRL